MSAPAFGKLAWLWLAPPERRLRARLLMELAYLADAERTQIALLSRSGTPEREEEDRLQELGDRAAREAKETASGVHGLDDALRPVVEAYWTEERRIARRNHAELGVSNFIWGEEPGAGRVLVGKSVSVGPYVEPARPGKQGRTFACLDRRGVPVAARGAPVEWTERTRNGEWSADRAAAIFVAEEGVEETFRLLQRATGFDEGGEEVEPGAARETWF